jgi:hypothetical protein
LKDLQLLIKLKNLKIWSYIWEDFSMLYINQIQRKGKAEQKEGNHTECVGEKRYSGSVTNGLRKEPVLRSPSSHFGLT